MKPNEAIRTLEKVIGISDTLNEAITMAIEANNE
jgi:hypothetical protein